LLEQSVIPLRPEYGKNKTACPPQPTERDDIDEDPVEIDKRHESYMGTSTQPQHSKVSTLVSDETPQISTWKESIPGCLNPTATLPPLGDIATNFTAQYIGSV